MGWCNSSDAHNLRDRPPLLLGAYDYVIKRYGERRVEMFVVTNPIATLSGAPLNLQEQIVTSRSRKWLCY